jgi:hypothetical protein
VEHDRTKKEHVPSAFCEEIIPAINMDHAVLEDAFPLVFDSRYLNVDTYQQTWMLPRNDKVGTLEKKITEKMPARERERTLS